MSAIRLSSKIKKLKFVICQSSKSSQGTRNFIDQYYALLKQGNPVLSISIIECLKIQPKLYIHAADGKKCIPLANLKADDIKKQIQEIT